MPATRPRPLRAAGVALILVGLALAAARWGEIAGRGPVNADPDDATASLRYLAENGDSYVATGLALLVAAGALVVASLAVRTLLARAEDQDGADLWLDATTVAAKLGAGLLALAGVIHISAPGPLGYINSLDPDWGEAGYIAVQTIGNQGVYAAGLLGLAVWQLGTAVLVFRRRALARWLLVFAFPAAVYLLGLTAAFIEPPEALFFVNAYSLTIGMPVWCVVIGVALLIRMRRQRAPRTSS